MLEVTFSRPYALLLLELIPLLLLFYFRNYRRQRSIIQLSTFSGFTGYRKTFRQRFIHLPFFLRLTSISLLIIAIANPRSAHQLQQNDTSKSAIAYVVDQSSGMLSKDFTPNRMESLRASLDNFMSTHTAFVSGLAGFSAGANIECPLTDDSNTLRSKLESMQVLPAGTRVPLNAGIETGIDLLVQEKASHKFLICFTSANNSGGPADETVMQDLSSNKISLYLVAISSEGIATTVTRREGKLVYQNSVIDLDETIFKRLTAPQNGQYFRVTDSRELDGTMLRISRLLEQHKTFWVQNYEGIFPFALVAALILCMELISRYTFLKSLP